MALDACAGKIYWLNESSGSFERANLNGSSQQTLMTFPGTVSNLCGTSGKFPEGFALDLAGGKVLAGINNFFRKGQISSIQQADLDGLNLETLLPFPTLEF